MSVWWLHLLAATVVEAVSQVLLPAAVAAVATVVVLARWGSVRVAVKQVQLHVASSTVLHEQCEHCIQGL
jgi:hypothetical protein